MLKRELGNIEEALLKIVESKKNALTILTEYILTRFKMLNEAVNYHETLKADFFERYHFVKDVRDDYQQSDYPRSTLISPSLPYGLTAKGTTFSPT